MKYNEIVFNGKYLIKQNKRGVQRYSQEMLRALDKIVPSGRVKVLVPHANFVEESFHNIEIIQYGGRITSKMWQHIAFQWYVWTHKALSVCLSDGVPFFNIGIYAIHDMRFYYELSRYKRIKSIIRGYYVKFMIDNAVKKAQKIVTVSEFSKKEIVKVYHIDPQKIVVCYNSWQHMKNVDSNDLIFEEYQSITPKEYFFILGGIEENKNMRWVKMMAQKYPNYTFVISGPPDLYYRIDCGFDIKSLGNVIHVGYRSDGEVKALLMNCRAFIFPSLYEGFGIPPLEALSVGAKVLCSNAACLPEIYQEYVSYFNPNDYDVDLDALMREEHPDKKGLLDMYSWEESAKKIYRIINELVN